MELPIFREVESVWFRARQRSGEPDQQETAPVSVGAGTGAAETAELARITAPPLPSRTRPDATPAGAPEPPSEATAPVSSTGVTAGSTAGTAGNLERVGEVGDAMRGDSPSDTSTRSPAGAAATTSADDAWRTAADDGWRAASTVAEMAVQERTPAGLPKRQPMAQLVPGGVEKSPATAQRRSPEAVRGLLSAYHRGVQRGREQTTDDEPSGGSGGSPSTPAGKERGT
jgi:hypothetical protein